VEGPFELSIDALQGRWQHSAGLGLFTVRGDTVLFDSGMTFKVVTRSDGALEAVGWTALPDRSSAEEIVWSNGQRCCSWTLEDDVGGLEEDFGIDMRNVIVGKRKRAPVDYKALDIQLREDEAAARKIRSDEEFSESEERRPGKRHAKEAKESMTSREWSDLHAKKIAAVMKLFEKWMLSTRSTAHEEKLNRRGSLSTTFPVCLTGAGQRGLEKELRVYGATVAHREQGSVIMVDKAARQKFAERHRDLWRSTPLPTPKVRDREKPRTGHGAGPAASEAAKAAALGVQTNNGHSLAAPAGSKSGGAVNGAKASSLSTSGVDGAAESVDCAAPPAATASAAAQAADAVAPAPAPAPAPRGTLAVAGGLGRLRKLRRIMPDSDESDGEKAAVRSVAVAPDRTESKQEGSPGVPEEREKASASNGAAAPLCAVAAATPPADPATTEPVGNGAATGARVAASSEAGVTAASAATGSSAEAGSSSGAEGEPTPGPVPPQPASPPRPDEATEASALSVPDSSAAACEPETGAGAAAEASAEPKVEPKAMTKSETKDEAKPETEAEAKDGAGAAAKPEAEAEAEARVAPPQSLEEAKARLEAGPPFAEARKILEYLGKVPVDAPTLVRTKVGVTVNKMKKKYQADSALVAAASELVERWKQIWQQQRQAATA